jgi:hypothetical protein
MKRQSAPLLASGARDRFGSRLAPSIKHGLRAIARSEGRSMSWVIEEVVIDYFHMRRPKYKRETDIVPIRRKAAA